MKRLLDGVEVWFGLAWQAKGKNKTYPAEMG
jgi:hypothetical protein